MTGVAIAFSCAVVGPSDDVIAATGSCGASRGVPVADKRAEAVIYELDQSEGFSA